MKHITRAGAFLLRLFGHLAFFIGVSLFLSQSLLGHATQQEQSALTLVLTAILTLTLPLRGWVFPPRKSRNQTPAKKTSEQGQTP